MYQYEEKQHKYCHRYDNAETKTNNTNNNPNNTLDTGDLNEKLAAIDMLINLTICNHQ